jgi:hypothetical protein
MRACGQAGAFTLLAVSALVLVSQWLLMSYDRTRVLEVGGVAVVANVAPTNLCSVTATISISASASASASTSASASASASASIANCDCSKVELLDANGHQFVQDKSYPFLEPKLVTYEMLFMLKSSSPLPSLTSPLTPTATPATSPTETITITTMPPSIPAAPASFHIADFTWHQQSPDRASAKVSFAFVLHPPNHSTSILRFVLLRDDAKVFVRPRWTFQSEQGTYFVEAELVDVGDYHLMVSFEWVDWPNASGCSKDWSNTLPPGSATPIISFRNPCCRTGDKAKLPRCASPAEIFNGRWVSLANPIANFNDTRLLKSSRRQWRSNSCANLHSGPNFDFNQMHRMWVLMIGDSTLEESLRRIYERLKYHFVIDNNDPYILAHARCETSSEAPLKRNFDTLNSLYQGKMRLSHLWIGHESPCETLGGIEMTLKSNSWMSMLDHFLIPIANSTKLPDRPSVIVLNSGLHDLNDKFSLQSYETNLEILVKLLLTKTDKLLLRTTYPKFAEHQVILCFAILFLSQNDC